MAMFSAAWSFTLLICIVGFYASDALSNTRLFSNKSAHNFQRRMASPSHNNDGPPPPPDGLLQPSFQITPAGAEYAMAVAEHEASRNGWRVTVCISDSGGTPILVKRNAFAASYDIAVGKAKSAALFEKETAALEGAVNVSDGTSRAALLSAPFVLMRGGVPLVVNGQCCGAVGVSGVRADQDEQVAKAAISALEASLSKL